MKRDYEKTHGHGFDTLAIRHGQHRTAEGEHSDPIFVTSSFVFEDARQAAERFAENEPGNIYSRFTNPTVRAFEERLAALEGGGYCTATTSGMGAILALGLATLKAGDRVVLSRNVFGSTLTLFNTIFTRFGVETTCVDLTDLDQWRAAAHSGARLMMLESPSNPLGEVADIEALADIARGSGALLVVDNVACTPALQRPLRHGADVVVHSATKYLDGQGRGVGGAVVTGDKTVGGDLYKVLRTAGPCMSPFNAWMFLKGLRPCVCGWRPTAPARSPSRAGWRHTPRWSACTTRGSNPTPATRWRDASSGRSAASCPSRCARAGPRRGA